MEAINQSRLDRLFTKQKQIEEDYISNTHWRQLQDERQSNIR